jgi:hypothetical protein
MWNASVVSLQVLRTAVLLTIPLLLVGSQRPCHAAYQADDPYAVEIQSQGSGGISGYGVASGSSGGGDSGLHEADLKRRYYWVGGGNPVPTNIPYEVSAYASESPVDGGSAYCEATAMNKVASASTVENPPTDEDSDSDTTQISEAEITLTGHGVAFASSVAGQSTGSDCGVTWGSP